MFSHGRTGTRTGTPGRFFSILGLVLFVAMSGVLLTSSSAAAANIQLRTLIYDQAGTTLLYGSTTSTPKLTLTVPEHVIPGQVLTIVVALDTAGQTFTNGYNISIDLDANTAGGGDMELTYVNNSAVQLAVRNSNGNAVAFSTSPQAGFTDATPRTATAAISTGASMGMASRPRTSDLGLFSFQVTVGPMSSITHGDADIAGDFDVKFTRVTFGSGGNTVQGNTVTTTATGAVLGAPEPSTLLLTGMGMLGLALAGKRARSPRGREPKEGNEAK